MATSKDALEEALARLTHGAGDLFERTGNEVGVSIGSKKGDFVVGIDPSRTRGVDLRLVVEAKDRTVSLRPFSTELAESRENGRAAVAPPVFTGQRARRRRAAGPHRLRLSTASSTRRPMTPSPCEVQGMKSRLTSIANAAGEVSRCLDAMRAGVLRAVGDVETQMSVIADAALEAQTA